MEKTIVDNKVQNLLGVLERTNKWDLNKTLTSETFDSLFEF